MVELFNTPTAAFLLQHRHGPGALPAVDAAVLERVTRRVRTSAWTNTRGNNGTLSAARARQEPCRGTELLFRLTKGFRHDLWMCTGDVVYNVDNGSLHFRDRAFKTNSTDGSRPHLQLLDDASIQQAQ
ncbi:MAG: hypothetical protein EOO65_01560 [Methanosarcinales archaeon]|nr:MAG: hypothetical protein EOO65_01560 [Methanosarcinales archaeon]